MRPWHLLLLAPAWASPEVPPGDPTVLTRAMRPADDDCPTRSDHPDFRVERAEARGRNAAEAVAAARRLAHAQLEAKVCAGIEDTSRCLAARRGIAPFGAGRFDRRTRSACASVVIHKDDLDSIDADLAAFGATMGQLAAVVAEASSGPVAIDAPVWAGTGCPVGETGAHLVTTLEGRMQGVTLAEPGAPGATQLRLKVSVGAEVTLAAALRRPGEMAWTPLGMPDLSFPADLFRLPAEAADACASDASLGLADGSRPGAGALGVDLVVAGAGGVVCEGEQIAPRVTLTAPARIRVYSVPASGEALAVWPWRADDDRIYGPEQPPPLPTFTGLRTAGGDTRLVVVAYPPDAAPPAPTFCRLAAPFSASALPAAAVVDAAGFHVVGAGERVCRARGDTTTAERSRARAEAQLASAPECN